MRLSGPAKAEGKDDSQVQGAGIQAMKAKRRRRSRFSAKQERCIRKVKAKMPKSCKRSWARKQYKRHGPGKACVNPIAVCLASIKR